MIPLLIMRHGPTKWNVEKRIQGSVDIPLSAEGRVAVESWTIPVQYRSYHCVSSPLSRAIETANILDLEPEQNDALREMSWGDWEGRHLPDLREKLGHEMAANEARGLDFCPLGGESPRDVQARLKPWLQSLTKPTLAIAHKGVIRALYALASGWDMCDKPDTKLKQPALHLFSVDHQGVPKVDDLNIMLAGDY